LRLDFANRGSIFPEAKLSKLHPKSWLNFDRFWNINFESILNKFFRS